MPDAWTIVVKVNNTGNDDFPFGGPGNLAFDANGYAWITNNTVQGTPNSCTFNVVLKPNGQPADGRQGTPDSILLGGGALGAGFGVDIAPNGNVWIGNFGWGPPAYRPSPLPDGIGSVVEYNKHGKPVSGDLGYHSGTHRVQGIATDTEGNVWICSFGNDRIIVFPKGNPKRPITFQGERGSAPFDVQIASDGTAWVTFSGGLAPSSSSTVARLALSNGQIREIFNLPLGTADKALALDSQGNAWVASSGDNCVYLLDPQGNNMKQFNGGGIDHPWTPAVDGDDNIFVANFGPQKPGDDFITARLTKLAGSNPLTRPPGLQTGDGISPSSGYTLPSAGEEVLLHNGDPLYGMGQPPAYTPFMRVTGITIDQAGNVWAANNWKPKIDVDLTSNPGGDGICIFVGLAKPPRS
jgi:sugar lactone lactonase YvrE